MSNIILIGNESDMGFRYHKDYQDKFKGVTVKTPESVADDIRFRARPEIGMIFIKHPYLDLYLPNNESLEMDIYRQSIQAVFNLAQKLGAIRCEYVLNIEERRFLGMKAKGTVSCPKGDGEVTVDGHTDKHFWQGLEMVYKNLRVDNSDIISESEYDDAKKLFESCEYLRRSPQALNMLEMRNPSSKTQRAYESLSYSLNENINEELAIAANLKTMGSVIRVKGEYSQKKQINRKVSAKYRIWFREQE